MKNPLHRILPRFGLITVSLLFAVSSPLQVLADGMIIQPYPDDMQWKYGNEESQLVYINYENGRQKMLISVKTQKTDNVQVWIFPVPAKPEKVVIANTDVIPSFSGTELSEKAKDYLSGTEMLSVASQLYPMVLLPFMFYDTYSSPIYDGVGLIGSTGSMVNEAARDVEVYDHIEKNGMTTELLTAQTTQGLADYFSGKGLSFNEDQLPVLDQYLGKDYSFVASWLISPKIIQYQETTKTQGATLEQQNYLKTPTQPEMDPRGGIPAYLRRGLLVSFPTDQIYFPLVPTSVYGSTTVPATIYVTGLVTPKIFNDIADSSEVEYFTDGYISNPDKNFIDISSLENGELDYTRITIQSPSKLLSEDLWISNAAPLQPLLSKTITSLVLLVFLAGFIFNSMLASTLSSMIVFKEARSRKFWKYSLFGLTNLLSFGTFLLVLLLLPTGSIKPEDQNLMDQLKAKHYRTWSLRVIDFRKLAFAPLFTIMFLVFSILGAEVIKGLL